MIGYIADIDKLFFYKDIQRPSFLVLCVWFLFFFSDYYSGLLGEGNGVETVEHFNLMLGWILRHLFVWVLLCIDYIVEYEYMMMNT